MASRGVKTWINEARDGGNEKAKFYDSKLPKFLNLGSDTTCNAPCHDGIPSRDPRRYSRTKNELEFKYRN